MQMDQMPNSNKSVVNRAYICGTCSDERYLHLCHFLHEIADASGNNFMDE